MWSFLALAFAGSPSPAEYNDRLVSAEWGLAEEFAAIGSTPYDVDSAEGVAARVQALGDALTAAEQRVAGIPLMAGDPGLRDAVARGIQETRVVLSESIPQSAALLAVEPPTDEHVAALEKLWVETNARLDAVEVAVESAQDAFARRFRLRLVPPEELPPEEALPFEAPEIVPAGSALPAGYHALFALGYRNHGVDLYNRVLEAHERFVARAARPDQMRSAVGEYRVALGSGLAVLEAWGPWRGDDALRAALLEAFRDVDAALGGDFLRYVALTEAKRLRRGEAEEREAAFARANGVMQRALQQPPAAFEAFDRRWAVDRFAAWTAALASSSGEGPARDPSTSRTEPAPAP